MCTRQHVCTLSVPRGSVVGDFATQAERDYLFGSRDFNTVYDKRCLVWLPMVIS